MNPPLVYIGKVYKFSLKHGTQRHERETVALVVDDRPTEVFVSGRPTFGTSEIPKEWIQSVEEVPKSTVPYANRIKR